jgi:hypothetical protein
MGGACSAYGQNRNKYVVVVKKGTTWKKKNIQKDNIKIHFNGVGRNIMNLITWFIVQKSGKHLSAD